MISCDSARSGMRPIITLLTLMRLIRISRCLSLVLVLVTAHPIGDLAYCRYTWTLIGAKGILEHWSNSKDPRRTTSQYARRPYSILQQT